MLIKELFEDKYSPRLSVYLDDVKDSDRDEIAGMLRGLMCAIEGWGKISGLTNDKFSSDSPVVLSFTSVEKAHYFQSCVKYYFDEEILQRLSLKKRVYK